MNETDSGEQSSRHDAADRLVREIIAESSLEESVPGTLGAKIERLRELLGLGPIEFAQRWHISPATYYRTLKQGRIPRHRAEDLQEFLERAPSDKETSGSVLGSLRDFHALHDRQVVCKRQWALKTLLPFRAAKHQLIKRRLTELLIKDKEAEFNCVFYAEREKADCHVSKWAAKHSFAQFKKMLYLQDPAAATRFRGWWVKDAKLAFELGLTTLDLGLSILEYDTERKSRFKETMPGLAEREVDYFFETPIGLYPSEDDARTDGQEEIRWVEWPSFRSAMDWVQRKKLLERLIKTDSDVVCEFLSTPEKILEFQIADYPG